MVPNGLLEIVIEVTVIKKNIRIMPPAVEMPFNGSEGIDNSIEFLISGQNDKGRVGSRPGGVDGSTPDVKDLVISLADFPTAKSAQSLIECGRRERKPTYRIEGGEPDGMRRPPDDAE